ncbi:hypothetical protein MKX01_023599 [Papaver californicum]|nr:hypothetical protein MKX01_023599 [Papaver californicum]
MKEEEVKRCQIQEWYPKFKSVSIKTQIHELPESFIEYLLDDSGPFLLPESITGEDALPQRIHNPEEDDFHVPEDSEDESEQPSPPPCFPELELVVKQSIETLDGAVFPKLNWSAPKDTASVCMTGNLKCTSFSEIALLLKSSETLTHDLCHAFDSCDDKTSSRPSTFYLALRKWYPTFRPEMEFRCFVSRGLLVGISQREVTSFYPLLLEKKEGLKSSIQEFFTENVQKAFESENYTFDVYVTKNWKIKIIDFNPWGAFTLPLLFDWEELEMSLVEDGDAIPFRIIDTRCGVRPGLKTAVPYDYLDTSPGSGWDQFLSNAYEERRMQSKSPEAGA